MKERIDRHKDGSLKAKGHMKDGELEGYWEWFRRMEQIAQTVRGDNLALAVGVGDRRHAGVHAD